jgi:hypothetical protein
MPLDISEQYIWLSSSIRTPYVFIEGHIRSDLAVEAIRAKLDVALEPLDQTSGERAYVNDRTTIVNLLVIRQDKCCVLIVRTPVDWQQSSDADCLSVIAADLLIWQQFVSSTLSNNSALTLTRLGCQIAALY